MRTIVIGDIHGGLKGLKQVLKRAKVSSLDKIIFLGDYIDGWNDSANVVSYLIRFSKKHTCIFLRGNHDDLCHKWLITEKIKDQWLMHGGQSTIDGYKNMPTEEIKAHIKFYDNMINYHIDNHKLFVHAGFQNQHGPEMEYHNTAFYWDRTLWEMAISLDKNLDRDSDRYPKRLKLFKEIFIGHTPVTRIGATIPVNAGNVWNIDTGAAFKGPVTAIDIDSKEFWQSDPVWQLYPSEDGRN